MPDLEKLMSSRLRSSYEYRIDVGRRTNAEIDEMIAWCCVNLQGVWNYKAIYGTYFFFTDSKDATLFSLKWSR